jgi:VRR-NUC domain
VHSERDLIDMVLLRTSQANMRFARNNSGIAFHKDGSAVAYGLFSPGGSDLIGWVPHKVTALDVGREIAIFAAVELKTGRQELTEEQRRFLRIVSRAGGIAAWGRDVETVMEKLQR